MDWNAASRNTAVSNPSRSTAKKAMPTSAVVVPLASADAALSSIEDFSSRAWRFIHTTIHVTAATAISAITVSRPSCCLCGSVELSASIPIPIPRQMAMAAPTPSHTLFSASDRPVRVEERGDDPDDQRGLEPLAQTDDERGDHVAVLLPAQTAVPARRIRWYEDAH